MLEQRICVVDLETTGSNYKTGDEIIEIGITFIENLKIVEQYNTLVRPAQEIPAFIKELTTISNEEVVDAPTFQQLVPQLFEKLQRCVFVAHNVNFDLKFLQFYFQKYNYQLEPIAIIDTVELARIMYPKVSSYQLEILTNELGINLSQAHRAEADALATAQLLLHAINKLKTLPRITVKKLYQLSKLLPSDLSLLLFDILQQHQFDTIQPLFHYYQDIAYYVAPKNHLNQNYQKDNLYEQSLEQLNLNYRKVQQQLINILEQNYQQGNCAFVEAPTGSGKTLAYLINACQYYLQHQQPTIIATHTLHLQEEIINVAEQLVTQLQLPIRIALIKSEKHYIQLNYVVYMLNDKEAQTYDIQLFRMRCLVWLLETTTGDLSELDLKGQVAQYFSQIMHLSLVDKAPFDYYQQALNQVNEANIVITNQSYLTYHELYQFKNYHIIIDEAHHLLESVNQHQNTQISLAQLIYHRRQIGKYIDGKLLYKYIEENSDYHYDTLMIDNYIQSMIDIMTSLFTYIYEEIEDDLIVLTPENSTLIIDDIIVLDIVLSELNHLLRFNKQPSMLEQQLQYHFQQISNFCDQLKKTLVDHQKGITIWAVLKHQYHLDSIEIHCHYDYSAQFIAHHFVEPYLSTQFISSTFQINNNFDYFKNSFDLPDAKTHQLVTPFDLKQQATIFINDTIIDESQEIQLIIEYILIFIAKTSSKVMVLFTSYQLMKQVADQLSELEILSEYSLLVQHERVNAHKLMTQFNQMSQAILLGTNKFWEGVNYQSEALKCVIMTKLPFPNYHQQLQLLSGEHQKNIFQSFVLPSAIIKFKQGIGRLIRQESDYGLVVCLDHRLTHKNYGKVFTNSVSDYHLMLGNIDLFKMAIDEQLQKQNKHRNFK